MLLLLQNKDRIQLKMSLHFDRQTIVKPTTVKMRWQ
jgi:hypothetical protein